MWTNIRTISSIKIAKVLDTEPLDVAHSTLPNRATIGRGIGLCCPANCLRKPSGNGDTRQGSGLDHLMRIDISELETARTRSVEEFSGGQHRMWADSQTDFQEFPMIWEH